MTELAIASLSDSLVKLHEKYSNFAVEAEGNDDWIESLAEDFQGTREQLLGSVFLLCQERITTIVSNALRCRTNFERVGLNVSLIKRNKKKFIRIRALGESNAEISRIEAMNAVANYFKHRSEWPHDWYCEAKHTQNKGTVCDIIDHFKRRFQSLCKNHANINNQSGTARIIKQVGITPERESIKHCLPFFGITNDAELHVLHETVNVWAKHIVELFAKVPIK